MFEWQQLSRELYYASNLPCMPFTERYRPRMDIRMKFINKYIFSAIVLTMLLTFMLCACTGKLILISSLLTVFTAD